MNTVKYTITIFLKNAGSNEGDLSGKLRFNDCEIINDPNDEPFEYTLKFRYMSASTGKMVAATFNLDNIVGYVKEEI